MPFYSVIADNVGDDGAHDKSAAGKPKIGAAGGIAIMEQVEVGTSFLDTRSKKRKAA